LRAKFTDQACVNVLFCIDAEISFPHRLFEVHP
jgi:hypothetical protein